MNSMPMNTRNSPLMMRMIGVKCSTFCKNCLPWASNMAVSKNGMASPMENTNIKMAPSATVPVLIRKVRMVPNIGPTQGVQPIPSKTPSKTELCGVPALSPLILGVQVVWNILCLNIPIISSPQIRINAPAMRLISNLVSGLNKLDRLLANTPRVTNTPINPTTNRAPLRMVWILVSLPSPVIKPIYAGINGKVQGAKNVSTPATKLPTKRDILSILFYFFLYSMIRDPKAI